MTDRPTLETPERPPSPALFVPHAKTAQSESSRASRSLPADLREQATRRLRVTAIFYSIAFFCADLLPSILTGTLAETFSHPRGWVLSVSSIAMGLLFAALISTPRLAWDAKVNLGLVFQVLASYGISLAMYLGIEEVKSQPLVLHVLSPSWPAIWMLFYAVVVPSPPRRALLGMIGSASSAPVVIGLVLWHSGLHLMTPFHFVLMHVLPYTICVMLAYVATRTVYRLGAAVSRARELGSYRLTERLGAGGMGEVWRASHQLLAREAAIKFIRPESIAGAGREQASAMLKRFELEARATASLTSAHTIDIYDFGVTEDGAFYYAMELLEGLDADRLVRIFGPLPAARVIHIASQVCESLEEAHARGLVHRDMKPANVYVCRNGRRLDFVKVLDFGLVAQHRVEAQDPRLTRPEQMIGTPDFMPPEMALGHTVDGRADLYGLGCVAYWLVTGKPVFEGASYYEVVSKHIQQPPDPPSKHATGVPAELDRLILQCLEKDPARRPAGAREIRHRLIEIAHEWPWAEEQAEAWWAENLPNGTPGVAGSALATPGSPVAVAAATPSRAPTLALRTRSGDRPGPDRP